MEKINSIEDAKRFLNKLTEVKVADVSFENETGFPTRYFFKTSKNKVMRSYTFGSGDNFKTEALTAELILADAELINEYFTNSWNAKEFGDLYGEF